MKKLYKAPMRKLTVSHLEISDGAIQKLEFQDPIIRKDLLFYRNLFGAYISFEYDTRLPDYGEATDYIRDSLSRRETPDVPPYPSCSFVKDDDFTYSHEVDDHVFKTLKKYYRGLRKENERKKK